jgi:hypothetical protein
MIGTRLQIFRNGPENNCDYTLKIAVRTNEDKQHATERLLDLVSGISYLPERDEFVYVYDAGKLQEEKINRES